VRLSTRPRIAPALNLFALGAFLPVGLLWAVGHDHAHLTGEVHFGAVGATALVATLASLALTVAGVRCRDGQTILVATAFSAMAGLLFLHGLASPGVLVGMNGVVALSGGATLPVGAVVLALSLLPFARGARGAKPLVVLQAALLAGIAALGAVGLLRPSLVPSVPEPRSTLAIAIMVASLALFAVLAFRALDTFLLTHRATDYLVVLGLVFLGTALVGALMFDFREVGWWLGHGYELVGLALVGSAVVADLRRAKQSRPLSGGLRAAELVASEEIFLGARVRALTARLAEKDGSTEEHTRRVALRAVQVGEALGLPPPRLRSLATGGLLHDIGKLAVPDSILKKPGPLTEEEFDVIRRHPEWGHRLLGELGDFSSEIRRLVLDHHERLDGTGYPRGLAVTQLDLETRILTVCDVYDALISTRVYRSAWTHEQALEHLHEQAGSAFDRRCIAALERVLAREHVAAA
jgi:HD-GYP domain-containing protein (c-di-GMP phosphodiesterase class II)